MAKSPTPIPAPPVKIHRGAPGSAPARQRRRRRRSTRSCCFCAGWRGGSTSASKRRSSSCCLCRCWCSWCVQLQCGPQRLFQGALAPRRIVDLMLQGYDVTNFEQMDEREVVQLFAHGCARDARGHRHRLERVLQFNRENTGVESFFNMGVTGADVRDNMTSYYKMVTYGKAPKVLLWSIDPWVFYGSEAAFDVASRRRPVQRVPDEGPERAHRLRGA